MSPLLGQAGTLPWTGFLLWGEREGSVNMGQYSLTHCTEETEAAQRGASDAQLPNNQVPKSGSNPDSPGSRAGLLTPVLKVAP